MNEIDVGYKYERVHQACLGDEVFIKGSWYNYSSLLASMKSLVIGAVRRPIHPGADHEIVPEDEARKFEGTYRDGIEFFNDGIWKMAPSPNFASGCTFRRRKSKSSPAMEEGWELVPKEELKFGDNQPTWEYKSLGDAEWTRCSRVAIHNTYRRPKSKPVEQYGWLKPDCGVEMPFDTPINARLKNGEMRIVMRRITGEVVFFSSHHPIPAPVAYWHRTGPAPEADKFDPCEEAFNGLMPTPAMSQESFDRDTFNKGWQACCDYYKVGDQSKK